MDKPTKDRLLKDIGSQDLLSAVLRSHLWVENELIKIVQQLLLAPDLLDLDRLSFSAKVELAAALGAFRAEEIPAYRNLNAVRNKLAHRFDFRLTEEDERSLLASLSNETRNMVHVVRDSEKPFPEMLQTALATLIIRLRVAYEQIVAQKAENKRIHDELVESLGGEDAYKRKVRQAIRTYRAQRPQRIRQIARGDSSLRWTLSMGRSTATLQLTTTWTFTEWSPARRL